MSAAPQIRAALMENLKDPAHLPAMRECFEQAAQQAEKETLSYERYLLRLTQRVCESPEAGETDANTVAGVRDCQGEDDG